MNRQTLSRATAAALLGVAVLMDGGNSYASDADDVKATINEFHAALTALDLAKINAVWAHDDRVMDKEPLAKAVTLGWEERERILKAWSAQSRNKRSLKARGRIFRFKAIRRGRWAWRPAGES